LRLTSGTSGTSRISGYPRLRLAVFCAFVGLTAVPGRAAETPSSVSAETVQIVVTEQDCRRLVAYEDTGAADYKPGVDAYGRPVTSADLDETASQVLPREVTFALTVRLADLIPGLTNSLSDSRAAIGEITVRGDEVLLNGQPLTDRQRNAVVIACRQRLGGEQDR
jgi:hypothetical protein